MIQKGNKIIASAGYYIDASNGKSGYSLLVEEGITYEEKELTSEITTYPDGAIVYGGKFYLSVKEQTKKWLKTHFVEQAYDNDDQIAIMLNKDNSEESLESYNRMQEWRKWADDMACTILKALENE